MNSEAPNALSGELEVLNLILSGRAVIATTAREHQAIADMAYGAWIACHTGIPDLHHLHLIVEIAEALADDCRRDES